MLTLECQDGVVCPQCKGPLDGTLTLSCAVCGTIGDWVAVERRFEWRLAGLGLQLRERVEAEGTSWDMWAAGATIGERQPKASSWLTSTRTMRAAVDAVPQFRNVAGKRMLDIGATCRHSVKFLKDGLSRLDHVEVSPESQRLALRRLEAEGVGGDRVFFHTVPAERLPFADETFDLVFSSGTIHHTLRTESLPEVHRVLKRGGEVLFIESYLPPHLQLLMKWRRGQTNEDRGTDSPLGTRDLRDLRSLFGRVHLYPFNILWLPWSRTFGRTAWGKARRSDIGRLDEALGDAYGIAHLLGTQCWVAARKE
jgi:SAM-dependent methyltransferase